MHDTNVFHFQTLMEENPLNKTTISQHFCHILQTWKIKDYPTQNILLGHESPWLPLTTYTLPFPNDTYMTLRQNKA